MALLSRVSIILAVPDGDRRGGIELDLRVALGEALIANQGWGGAKLGEVHPRARELATLNRPRALLFALLRHFRKL